MKQRIRTLRYLLTGVFLSASACIAQDPCATDKIPPAVERLVKQEFAYWRIKTVQDLEGSDREVWLKAHPKDCPGLAMGYLDQTRSRAFALLLIPEQKPEEGFKLVLVSESQAGHNKFEYRILEEHVDWHNGALVVAKVPPGLYSSFDREENVVLKSDGILLERLEAWAVLYYLRNGQYQKLNIME